MAFSKYEGVAQAFVARFPIGSRVTAVEILEWAKTLQNGHRLAPDLAEDEPRKQVSKIRLHLNDGAGVKSAHVAEDQRFFIDVIDAAAGIYFVRPFHEHAEIKCTEAFGKSVLGALNPLRSSVKVVDSVKLDELNVNQRTALEAGRGMLEELQTPMRALLNGHINRHMVATLTARGYTREQARDMIDAMPAVSRFQKLLRANGGIGLNRDQVQLHGRRLARGGGHFPCEKGLTHENSDGAARSDRRQSVARH
jgi:hypothetical protein